jgi:aryl-alcohol dehydrogenase-like predicted oxidoreductase
VKTRKLGRAGPEISVVGYGALGGWGGSISENDVVNAVRAGITSGINWVDTAEVYRDGQSEEVVGRALQGFEDVLVFTKVAPRPSGTGLHADGVRAAAEASLRRLDREVIDLFQVHFPDPEVPIEETWEAMASLVDDGLVRFIGVSNFGEDLIALCESIRHVDSLQPQLSLLHRPTREHLIPFCQARGTGVICFGPLAFGLLTGDIDAKTVFAADDWRPSLFAELFGPAELPANLARVAALLGFADGRGIPLPQIAIAWVIAQTGVTGAIVGARSVEHVRQSAGAGDVEVTPDDLHHIEAILADQPATGAHFAPSTGPPRGSSSLT